MDADFLGVYPSGFATRACHVEQLSNGPSVADFAIRSPRALRLGPDTALIAYLAEYSRPGDARSAMYVSSIWRRSGSDDGPAWINIFSQDTPVE